MLTHEKARSFGTVFPDYDDRGGDRAPASLAELTALCLLAPPCCGHIALCDGACRDTRRTEWHDRDDRDDAR